MLYPVLIISLLAWPQRYQSLKPSDLIRPYGFIDDGGAVGWSKQVAQGSIGNLDLEFNPVTVITMPLWVNIHTLIPSNTGVPNLQGLMPDDLRWNWIEIKCTINGVPWNHLETIPHPHTPTTMCEKIVFHKTGPWCQKGWGPLAAVHSGGAILFVIYLFFQHPFTMFLFARTWLNI